RDEGTSYHYMAPSREIEMDERIVQVIENTLIEQKAPYIKAKTWTTDAFFRETPGKVELRKEEGCVTVEMETSAFIATARYNQVDFGQILYAGDSLAGEVWDKREWHNRTDVREYVLKLALDACLKM
ncbi:MAG: nucleoside phosphorylase, partial [Defluviitaleaceae bacterium]|nr:nucleoside phosphorylase [Defluviitaleaceae bacterium]